MYFLYYINLEEKKTKGEKKDVRAMHKLRVRKRMRWDGVGGGEKLEN